MEEIRQQFDKWWDEKLSGAFHSCPKEHRDSAYHAAWLAYQEAWKQSRAALVVELPTQEKYDDPLSAYTAIRDCKGILSTAGITVKGEGDGG